MLLSIVVLVSRGNNWIMGGQSFSKVGPHFTIHVAEYSSQGKRSANEDKVFMKLDFNPKGKKKLPDNPSLFCVMDGHSGDRCANYLKNVLPDLIRNHEEYGGDWDKVLKDSFDTADRGFLQDAQKKTLKDGSTCLLVAIQDQKVICANVGDCRAILVNKSQKETPTVMSTDHKPDEPSEKERIIKHGGTVKHGRINGNKLSVSRSFGDLKFKNVETHEEYMVSAVPEVRYFDISKETEFIVIACDGFWDVISNEEMLEFVRKELEPGRMLIEERMDPSQEIYALCMRMTEWAGQKGSKDNLSCVLIVFDHNHVKMKSKR
uniref:protein-serine/threonine phosphatase n=1 Tax=Paramoeba aestuarina TaxID=180227 RepID=A0A7S4NTT2_9EUKA